LTLRDVQTILGHRHLETTATTYLYEDEVDVARRVLAHLAKPEPSPTPNQGETARARYRPEDLDVLFLTETGVGGSGEGRGV
jgi:integrase/recombinase XerD